MADINIAQIAHLSQLINSELEELNHNVSGAWRSLASVSEHLYELINLYEQLSQNMSQDLKQFSGSWLSYKKHDES